ncbi:MAG: fructose-6-phosphate aldolase [Bacteroidota bacterium]
MYVLKIKGSAKIPDYIQIRDSKFTLVAYFRTDNISSGLQQCNLKEKENDFRKIINKIPFGKIFKLPF